MDYDIMGIEHKRFLDALRKSGVTNMFGAAEYLVVEFGLDRDEATAILAEWMRTYTNDNDTA
jgi:hypothetical protein